MMVFIPRLMLADFKIGIVFEASLTLSNCSVVSPVVQRTTGIFLSTAYERSESIAFTDEKSMITSISASHLLISVYTLNPRESFIAISTPATISTSGSFAAISPITLPIRPLQPCIIILVIYFLQLFF